MTTAEAKDGETPGEKLHCWRRSRCAFRRALRAFLHRQEQTKCERMTGAAASAAKGGSSFPSLLHRRKHPAGQIHHISMVFEKMLDGAVEQSRGFRAVG